MFSFLTRIKKTGSSLGPGIITGAADDDPSGIATYSQSGAQFGYGQLWTVIFLLPLMVAVQEASARIGAVKGKGIAAVVKEHFGKRVLFIVIGLILVANIINLGVDLVAMAAAANLLVPIPFTLLIIFFSAAILFLEIYTSYRPYARILKWLSLSLLAYPLTLFIVHQPWIQIVKATFLPHIEFNLAFLFIITGVVGTTISPYMFFWQASEEIEEAREERLIHKDGTVLMNHHFMKRLRLDNLVGMIASQIATWSIIVTTATVLNGKGILDIRSAADAAAALEPLVSSFPNAGFIAKFIFAVGIIGLGLLAVPVLAGSAAYALSEALGWRHGLDKKLKEAPGFYAIIITATLIGLSLNFIGINPIKALVYAAVINGIVCVPLLFIIAKIASSQKIMGNYASGKVSKIFVWLAFGVILVAAASLLFAR